MPQPQPTLLNIPREIRDEIYSWALSDSTLPSSQLRELQTTRKKVTSLYSSHTSDPDSIIGEDAMRYPIHTSLPPTHGLLHTARQIRREFLSSLKRLSCLRYKIDVTNRNDIDHLIPTWTSVPCLPCFVDKIDVLEVNWRERHKKTSSVVTYCEEYELGSGRETATLALLQRFLERGVYLLSKKKREKVRIGLLEAHLNPGKEANKEDMVILAEDTAEFLDHWMVGTRAAGYDVDAREREEAQFRLMADRIERVRLLVDGELYREWEMSEMVVKRDEYASNEAMEE